MSVVEGLDETSLPVVLTDSREQASLRGAGSSVTAATAGDKTWIHVLSRIPRNVVGAGSTVTASSGSGSSRREAPKRAHNVQVAGLLADGAAVRAVDAAGEQRTRAAPQVSGRAEGSRQSVSASSVDQHLLLTMIAEETAKWEALEADVCMLGNTRDGVLRSFARQIFKSGRRQLHGGASPSPQLPDVFSVRLSDLYDISHDELAWPGVEVLNAFSACAAGYAGALVSPDWLNFQFGESASFSSVACVNGGGGVSSVLMIRGTTLFVASAEVEPRTWNSWVDFFASPLVEVDELRLQRALSESMTRFPGSFAVHPYVWASAVAQERVQEAVWCAVADSRVRGAPVTDVVFCGHGMGGAVAQLLALFFTVQPPGPDFDEAPVASSVVTFGAPSIGDAALQEHLLQLTRHTRLYVEHDPIAGLPRSTCVGLRFTPDVERYAEALAQEHWVLSEDDPPRPGSGASPRVLALSVAGLAYESDHPFLAYAVCLPRPPEPRHGPAPAGPSVGARSDDAGDAAGLVAGGNAVESASAAPGGTGGMPGD